MDYFVVHGVQPSVPDTLSNSGKHSVFQPILLDILALYLWETETVSMIGILRTKFYSGFSFKV